MFWAVSPEVLSDDGQVTIQLAWHFLWPLIEHIGISLRTFSNLVSESPLEALLATRLPPPRLLVDISFKHETPPLLLYEYSSHHLNLGCSQTKPEFSTFKWSQAGWILKKAFFFLNQQWPSCWKFTSKELPRKQEFKTHSWDLNYMLEPAPKFIPVTKLLFCMTFLPPIISFLGAETSSYSSCDLSTSPTAKHAGQ